MNAFLLLSGLACVLLAFLLRLPVGCVALFGNTGLVGGILAIFYLDFGRSFRRQPLSTPSRRLGRAT